VKRVNTSQGLGRTEPVLLRSEMCDTGLSEISCFVPEQVATLQKKSAPGTSSI